MWLHLTKQINVYIMCPLHLMYDQESEEDDCLTLDLSVWESGFGFLYK